jgi:hypothetical protein
MMMVEDDDGQQGLQAAQMLVRETAKKNRLERNSNRGAEHRGALGKHRGAENCANNFQTEGRSRTIF